MPAENSTPYVAAKTGGGERSRTADLPRAKRTLYQLSYTPESESKAHHKNTPKGIDYLRLREKTIQKIHLKAKITRLRRPHSDELRRPRRGYHAIALRATADGGPKSTRTTDLPVISGVL